jgi:Cu(I)/Ag(I) efflux system membrane fusion protein
MDLTEEQRKAIADFLTVADAMAGALAADDLEKFHTASEPAMDITGAMIKSLRPVVENLDPLDSSRHFHGFDDIQAARTAFHKFSVAAVAILDPLRKAGQTPEFEIYECGMVDEAIPGVPKKARWIQTGKRPMANPFFGSEMLECGKEIQ